MQLADAAWRLVVIDGMHSAHLWGEVLTNVRTTSADGFELRFSGFAAAEQAVMRLAAGDGALHGRDAELLSLSASSAVNAKRTLIDRGQIETAKDARVQVIDPLFSDWVSRRFPI